MARLLDKKRGGKYPFQYRSAAETDLKATFARLRRKKPQSPALVLVKRKEVK